MQHYLIQLKIHIRQGLQRYDQTVQGGVMSASHFYICPQKIMMKWNTGLPICRVLVSSRPWCARFDPCVCDSDHRGSAAVNSEAKNTASVTFFKTTSHVEASWVTTLGLHQTSSMEGFYGFLIFLHLKLLLQFFGRLLQRPFPVITLARVFAFTIRASSAAVKRAISPHLPGCIVC